VTISERVVRVHDRHELGVAVLERAGVDANDQEAVALARSCAARSSTDRLRERRSMVDRVRNASRVEGLAPLEAVRRRLDDACGADVLADPGAVGRAIESLGVDARDPLAALLGAVALRGLDADPPTAASVREVAVLGIARAAPRLRALEDAYPDAAREFRRARATLVPRDPAEFSALLSDPDVVARRHIAAFSSDRGEVGLAALLIPGLADADEDVRLYADRALRRLTGKNVGYDYLAPPADRSAGAGRWQQALR
jgi:hypothetical protein